MIPILYATTENAFTSHGSGFLTDCISCMVTQELNGIYEMEMCYPVTGQHYSEIELRSLILCRVDAVSDLQPFRVYEISRPLSGKVMIYARHISYDMQGTAVSPCSASSLGTAMIELKSHAVGGTEFNFWTDKSVSKPFNLQHPASLWDCMGGIEGSLLDTYGGEWELDGMTAKLHLRRGADRGVRVVYGRNMKDLKQDENCASVYSAVYPYYWNADAGVLVELPEKTLQVSGVEYSRVLTLNCSDQFQAAPTVEELREFTETYIEQHDLGSPAVSWSVDFISLADTEEYKNVAALERVFLGDSVQVYFEKLGVDASARVKKIVYNALTEKYKQVTLGSIKNGIAGTISAAQKEIDEKPSRSTVKAISNDLTKSLLGHDGGCVRLIDTNADGCPDELYIADDPDPAQAVKVWRWNYNGWAASNSGYNGEFIMGATLEDGILANAVTAAQLTAGTITSADGETFYLNLDTGTLRISTERGIELNEDGITVNRPGTEMKTNINEDGLHVSRGDTPVLDADSAGVNALNLTARNYLIQGNSRFESYRDGAYTAVFWIGE